MDPEEVAKAHAAIARGNNPQKVAAIFRERTGYDLPSPAALQSFMADTPEAALARLSAGGGNALTDFAHMAAQGVTARFSDELAGLGAAVVPGGKDYTEARDAERRRIKDLKILNPKAAALAEMAGAVAFGALPTNLTPLGSGMGAVLKGQVLPAIGRGAVQGGALSGLFGAGGSEASTVGGRLIDAAKAVPPGAAMGAAFAALPVAYNAIRNTNTGPGLRVAATIPDQGINTTRQAGMDKLGAAGRDFKGMEWLGKTASGESLKASPTVPQVVKDMIPDGPVDFVTMQSIDQTLAAGTSVERKIGRQFRNGMESVWPGYKQAVADWRAGKGVFRDIKLGSSVARKSAADVKWAMGQAENPAVARQAANQPFLNDLRSQATGIPHTLMEWMNAGPERLDRMREIFPPTPSGTVLFQKLLDQVNREKSALKVRQLLSTIVKTSGLIGAGWLAKNAFGRDQ